MSKLGKLLIVDDDPLVLESLYQVFTDDYQVILVSSGAETISTLQDSDDIDAIILDIRMAKMDGLETAKTIREINPDLPIIFYTGYPGDYSETRIDKEHQPFDYVVKNERPMRLQRAVKNAISYYQLKTKNSDLRKLAFDQFGMVGKSSAMLEVYRTIEKIAPTDIKVMVLGPTGSGKELVARAIHKRGSRCSKKLGILNCNHKSVDLVESELFGHLKGSFTGAIMDRMGLFEYANGGTVFLDEIGDLDITTQAKLLRVLETGEMQKIGSPKVMKVDVRLICATHENLSKMVTEGRFREDLFYRLKGVTILLPPLKDRREDIPELINHFVEDYCARHGDGIKMFESEALDILIEYDWPGNVRQLLDTVESLLALSSSSIITRQEVSDFLSYSDSTKRIKGSFNEQVREMKRLILIRTLARHENNVASAARELSLDRSNLYKLLKDLDIEIG
jgi:two-component system nitrogen regulation response regulator NtrX